jgi:hypothetical protein
MKDAITVSRGELVQGLSMFGGPRAALTLVSGVMGASELPAPLAAICDALEGNGEVTVSITGPGIEHRIVIR